MAGVVSVCGYKWFATRLLAPGSPREVVVPGARIPVRGDHIMVEQKCCLADGHLGHHRSLMGVINTKGAE